MSTLPTPRTDAWLKEPDQRTATSALSLARQLEHELAEAKAERDALEREVENITANYDEVCLQVKEYADATPLQVERDFKQRDEIKALAADLSRWRALAEEMAGAIKHVRLPLSGYVHGDVELEAFRISEMLETCDTALARFRAASGGG